MELKKFCKRLEEVKKLKLPENEFSIFGSGPLAVRGIRNSKDIDIIVKYKLWKELIKKYLVINKRGGFIKIGEIEIHKGWKPWFNNTNKLINGSDIFNCIRFVKLEKVIEWKKKFNREKDKKDIELINKYLKNATKKNI